MLFIVPHRIFITGGAGFIGSHVVDECLASGHAVLAYDNFSVGRREHLPEDNENLQIVEGDILNEETLKKALEEFSPTHVIHLAAIHFIPYCNEHPLEAIDVNIKGTEQILGLLRALQLPDLTMVVVASSAAVYSPSTSPHTEEEQPGPTDIYGLTKYANEMQAKAFQQSTGINTVAARLFNAYGPRETNPHLIPEIFQQYREGNHSLELGNLTTMRSYVFVKDLARGLLLLVETDALNGFDVCNIGSHAEYNAEQILELLSQVADTPLTCTSTAERQRKSDRPRLQPSLKKIEAMGWTEQYDIHSGLKEILEEEV
tara:strand:- start:368 stop:1315 length:948 start_codon:yes stop_codon:yes gene_type:complete